MERSTPTVSGIAYALGGGLYLLIVGTIKRSFAFPNDLPTSERRVLDKETPTLDMALLGVEQMDDDAVVV